MTGILIVRDDGVIRVDNAQPIPRSFVEAIEQLHRTLDVRPHDGEHQNPNDHRETED